MNSWWFLLKLKAALLANHCTLPPRRIADEEIRNLPRWLRSPDALRSAILTRVIERRRDFEDPDILFADITAWHNKDRGKQLASAPYRGFVKSWYWLAISSCLEVRKFACERCRLSYAELSLLGSTLQAHHIRYHHRGFELFHLEDLAVLCDFCHARTHAKETRQRMVSLDQILANDPLMRIIHDERALCR